MDVPRQLAGEQSSFNRGRRCLAIIAAVLLGACGDTSRHMLAPTISDHTIVDGAHAGNPHFYWLAPMVKTPSFSGTFDGSLSPEVNICQWSGTACSQPVIASFTTTTGPGSETVRVDTGNSLYIVNWHTDQFSLVTEATYRITASVLGATIGSADVQVLSNGSAKNATTGDDIALVDGKTLPIKFRIEQGMVVSVVITPNPSTVVVNQTDALTATLTDAHGNAVLNQPVLGQSAIAPAGEVSAPECAPGAPNRMVGASCELRVAPARKSGAPQVRRVSPPGKIGAPKARSAVTSSEWSGTAAFIQRTRGVQHHSLPLSAVSARRKAEDAVREALNDAHTLPSPALHPPFGTNHRAEQRAYTAVIPGSRTVRHESSC